MSARQSSQGLIYYIASTFGLRAGEQYEARGEGIGGCTPSCTKCKRGRGKCAPLPGPAIITAVKRENSQEKKLPQEELLAYT